MKKCLLMCVPPTITTAPHPAMSILKTGLISSGFDVELRYLNLDLYGLSREFNFKKYIQDDVNSLALFWAYLSIKEKDSRSYDYVKTWLMTLNPSIMLEDGALDSHILSYVEKLDSLLEEIILNYDFSNISYVGFSLGLYQWVVASIIAKKIKNTHPSVKIIVGGIGTVNTALAFLNNFPQFDIAVWGEGEVALIQITQMLHENIENHDFSLIPGVVYRNGKDILKTSNLYRKYIDFSDKNLKVDFTDYFQQLKEKKDIFNYKYIRIPIEGSRGCHWGKCHFCYLNTGYKYRTKEVTIIIDEIRNAIVNHKVYRFEFLDNDLIGTDISRFEALLDALILLKKEYPEFVILIGEIITKDVSPTIIKKIAQAGFINIQIGYESLSDSLLKKIDKKNTIASNLFFIKFAHISGIRIGGMNIIQNLIEETDSDIMECIHNLPFLRFFLAPNQIMHLQIYLAVNQSSKYFKFVKDELSTTWRSSFTPYLPNNYIKKKNIFFILDFVKVCNNPLWDRFSNLNQFYLKNRFEYSFLTLDKLSIYREYLNGELHKQIEFSHDSLEFFILKTLNDQNQSLESLYQKNKDLFNISESELTDMINELFEERIVYHNLDYSEISSIVVI